MQFRHRLVALGALILGLLLPVQAMAAYEAYTRADLNLRVGPATHYGVIDVIPYGDPVIVLGCLDQFYWCDVEWYGLRGWVAAEYLVQPGTQVYLPHVAPRLGLPIIAFSFGAYHDRHYRDRPWHRQRSGRWRGRDWRVDRPRRTRTRIEQPRQRQEIERPRRQRSEQRRDRRRDVQQPRRQRSDQRRPQRSEQRSSRPQRSEQRSSRPQRSEQRSSRPQRSEQRQQRSEQRSSRPRGEVTQRPRQGSRSERRSRGGDQEERQRNRGQ